MRTSHASSFRAVMIAAILSLITSAAWAGVITLGVPTNDTLAQNGTAEYTVVLHQPGRLTIQFSGWQSTYNWGADYDRLYMFNSLGNPVAIEQFGSEGDPFFSHMMETDGTYTINVGQAGTYTIRLHSGSALDWPGGATMQSYTLTVTLAPANDINEPNETIQSATLLALNTPMTAYQWRKTPTATVTGDEDVYRISLPSPGILTLRLSGWVSTFNWGADYDRLYIYRADGTKFDSSNADQYYDWMMGVDDSTVVYLSAGGDYYIQYHAGAGTATAPYTLTAAFLPINDLQEPNDTAAQADTVTAGVTYTAYQWKSTPQGPIVRGDEDWYRFTTTGGSTIITVTGWQSTYDWGQDYDLAILYRESAPGMTGDEIFRQHMIGNPFSRAVTLTAGTYLLNMHSGAGIKTTPYSIKIDYAPVGVTETTPLSFVLNPVSPNPFNGAASISFTLPSAGQTRLSVYSLTGQKIRTLTDDILDAGQHSMIWDGRSDDGSLAASGVYFARLETSGMVRTTRLTLMK